ncbi:MAG: hypothetical protein LT080_05020 [Thiobacillus sp.]|nr:hypothetical protein [Thiobacillus sp.]
MQAFPTEFEKYCFMFGNAQNRRALLSILNRPLLPNILSIDQCSGCPSRLRGSVLIRWIPASAGMTQFYLMGNSGLFECAEMCGAHDGQTATHKLYTWRAFCSFCSFILPMRLTIRTREWNPSLKS